jgi:hypothetical protein
MNGDMIRHDTFFDATDSRRVSPSDPRTREKSKDDTSERGEDISGQDAPPPLMGIGLLTRNSSMAGPSKLRGVGADFTAAGYSAANPKRDLTVRATYDTAM